MGKKASVIYSRTSSKKNAVKLSASMDRQVSQAKKMVKSGHHTKVVSEVKSGCLPVAQRPKLARLLEPASNVDTIYCESARAIARDAAVQEDVWRRCQAAGIKIVPADSPDLFKLNPSPGESLLRRIMGVVQQYDRDAVVDRLAKGRARARKLECAKEKPRRNQQGLVKVSGRRSLVESNLKLLQANKTKLKKLQKDFEKGILSSRQLASELNKASCF
jgi:DNA invertase Pin-like site-specific DNA recombinase